MSTDTKKQDKKQEKEDDDLESDWVEIVTIPEEKDKKENVIVSTAKNLATNWVCDQTAMTLIAYFPAHPYASVSWTSWIISMVLIRPLVGTIFK